MVASFDLISLLFFLSICMNLNVQVGKLKCNVEVHYFQATTSSGENMRIRQKPFREILEKRSRTSSRH